MLALGTHRSTWVRAAIGSRTDCPFGLMVTLAHDYAVDVRCAVAANPSAQRSVMEYLAADKSVDVVLALIENPSLAEPILEDLAFHKKSDVRAAATARLDSGTPGVPEQHGEDEHTPELADHVVLMEMASAGAFGPTSWPMLPSASPVPEAVEAPQLEPDALAPSAGPDSAELPLVIPGFAGFPHGDPAHHAHHAGTRTAPVRGFRPPTL